MTPAAIAELLAIDHPTVLDAGTPHAARERLSALSLDELFAPHAIRDADAARACLAGLWLRFDCLDESHAVSQALDTADGAFWHGIMHRREGDFGNAKYWFRRVGAHPALRGDPFAFVDRVEACVRGRGGDAEELKALQRAEWDALFAQCLAKTVGDGSALPKTP